MRLKKLICIILVTAMVAAIAACGNSHDKTAEISTTEEALPEEKEISLNDISVTWDDSQVYNEPNLDTSEVITTYGVEGYEDVPFVMARDYLDIIFKGNEKVDIEDGVMKVELNGTQATIDPENDTIYFENPAKFREEGDIDGGLIDKEDFIVISPSVKNKSVQTDASPITVSLKGYHMPIIVYEDDLLMPFHALQSTFGGITDNNGMAYNGKDYYNIVKFMMENINDRDALLEKKPYVKALTSGPFSKKEKASKAYAENNYNSLCLLLDLTFGHKEEKNITNFDEYFSRINAKKALRSTSPSEVLMTEIMIFNYLFDSGHDSIASAITVFKDSTKEKKKKEKADKTAEDIKNSEEGDELFDEKNAEQPKDTTEYDGLAEAALGSLTEKGFKIPEIAPLYAWNTFLSQAKPKNYGSERLDYVDDTAVIYFDTFKDDHDRKLTYYESPITKEDEKLSNFAFFYNCFKDIKKHDKIKNVVINLSDNGGGDATGLVNILGFLSKDGEVKITDRDLLSGSYREECYHVDTNLDGKADDKDGYGGQYDFFILTSGASYSCANALPYYAQQSGLAKIMGAKPGGGDCVVGFFVDGNGYSAAYSSFIELGKEGKKGFVSDEKSVKMDYNMINSILDIATVPWFDAKGITQAVHRYINGLSR